jgi:CRISPR/Cas system-associated exonuclease Cas4 (RecB family)
MSRNSLKSVARLIDIANKDVPAESSFLEDLKRSIELDTNRPSKRKPSLTFKPSGMQCGRQSYYFLSETKADEPKPTSYNMAGICNSGTDIHVRIQNAVIRMAKNGIDCEWVDVEEFIKSRGLDDLSVTSKTDTETKLYNKKYNMSFMCDGIVRYRGKYYILEFKTETSNKWYSREGVDKKHYNQGIAYSLNFELDNVIFIYIDRDMLQMKSFMFNVTDSMRRGLVEYMNEVNGYLERKIVPPKPDVPKNICSYCSYQMNCRKDK